MRSEQACVGALLFARLHQQRLWLRRSEGAGWVLGVSCQVWIRPVSVRTQGWFIHQCIVYEVIFFFSFTTLVSTARLLTVLPASLFNRAPWQRPALAVPLCILLTLAAVSLPQCDKTRLNCTHTCALWCKDILNRHHSHIHKSKTEKEVCSLPLHTMWAVIIWSVSIVFGGFLQFISGSAFSKCHCFMYEKFGLSL